MYRIGLVLVFLRCHNRVTVCRLGKPSLEFEMVFPFYMLFKLHILFGVRLLPNLNYFLLIA